jgi:hypothetical protein
MKKILLILIGFVLVVSCDETEAIVQDPVNGQQAFGFETASQTVTVLDGGTTATVNVLSVRRSNEDRSIPVSIDPSTTGDASDYQVGSVLIPAGEHVGVLSVDFNNFANMSDCVTNTLVLNLDADSPGTNGPQQYTFSYVKDFACPDLFLNITFDDYPGETTWQVTDTDGNVLVEGDGGDGSPVSENICLCPGDYVFTIFDSFGDGICCSYGNGSYEMVFNGTVLFSGGEFGSESVHNFTID